MRNKYLSIIAVSILGLGVCQLSFGKKIINEDCSTIQANYLSDMGQINSLGNGAANYILTLSDKDQYSLLFRALTSLQEQLEIDHSFPHLVNAVNIINSLPRPSSSQFTYVNFINTQVKSAQDRVKEWGKDNKANGKNEDSCQKVTQTCVWGAPASGSCGYSDLPAS